MSGLSRLTNFYGNQDDNTALLSVLLQEGAEEISLRVDWHGLLRRVAVSASPFALPDDFRRIYTGGAVMLTDGSFARPAATSAVWEIVRKASSSIWYFLDDRQLQLSFSSPSVFSYLSRNWVMDSHGNDKATMTADDDFPVFPAHLLVKDMLWRWCRSQGLGFSGHLQEFEGALAMESSIAGGSSG